MIRIVQQVYSIQIQQRWIICLYLIINQNGFMYSGPLTRVVFKKISKLLTTDYLCHVVYALSTFPHGLIEQITRSILLAVSKNFPYRVYFTIDITIDIAIDLNTKTMVTDRCFMIGICTFWLSGLIDMWFKAMLITWNIPIVSAINVV